MKKFGWLIFGGLCIFFSLYPLKYLFAEKAIALLSTKSPEILKSTLYNIAFYTHISFGGIALLIGWLQFHQKIRKKYTALHKTVGKIYVVSILISGPSGFYISFFASGGISTFLGFSIGALLWTILTFLGYLKIRQGNLELHKKYMMYSYAGTFGAVTLRLWLPLLMYIFGSFIIAYQIVAWLSWLPNLIIAHLILKKNYK